MQRSAQRSSLQFGIVKNYLQPTAMRLLRQDTTLKDVGSLLTPTATDFVTFQGLGDKDEWKHFV